MAKNVESGVRFKYALVTKLESVLKKGSPVNDFKSELFNGDFVTSLKLAFRVL
jgi:hypothetical protein